MRTVWSGGGFETALMSVEAQGKAITRFHPRIFIQGDEYDDVVFLKSVWVGLAQSMDDSPEILAFVASEPGCLEAYIQLCYAQIGYDSEIQNIDGETGILLKRRNPGILLTTFVEQRQLVDDGEIIRSLDIPWMYILSELGRNPQLLFSFSDNPRSFEEFLAACYKRAGWDEVILTPQRGDKGRDIIAINNKLKLRYIDQAKAFSPGRVVTADDVRSMWGVFNLDGSSTKAVLSTTSRFAPGVYEEFSEVIPYRLELRDGDQILNSLKNLHRD